MQPDILFAPQSLILPEQVNLYVFATVDAGATFRSAPRPGHRAYIRVHHLAPHFKNLTLWTQLAYERESLEWQLAEYRMWVKRLRGLQAVIDYHTRLTKRHPPRRVENQLLEWTRLEHEMWGCLTEDGSIVFSSLPECWLRVQSHRSRIPEGGTEKQVREFIKNFMRCMDPFCVDPLIFRKEDTEPRTFLVNNIQHRNNYVTRHIPEATNNITKEGARWWYYETIHANYVRNSVRVPVALSVPFAFAPERIEYCRAVALFRDHSLDELRLFCR